MSEKLLRFPKARLAFGAGDLNDVYDVNLAATDGRKLFSTLRNNPAGWIEGERSTNLTFKSGISEEGFERDYLKKWQKGDTIQLRLKVPGGKTITIEGVLTNPVITSNTGAHTDFSISTLGAISFD